MARSYNETLLNKLQKSQNRAARIVTNSESDAPVEPLLKKTGEDMMYKCVDESVTAYLSDLLHQLENVDQVPLTNS